MTKRKLVRRSKLRRELERFALAEGVPPRPDKRECSSGRELCEHCDPDESAPVGIAVRHRACPACPLVPPGTLCQRCLAYHVCRAHFDFASTGEDGSVVLAHDVVWGDGWDVLRSTKVRPAAYFDAMEFFRLWDDGLVTAQQRRNLVRTHARYLAVEAALEDPEAHERSETLDLAKLRRELEKESRKFARLARLVSRLPPMPKPDA